MQQHLFRVGLVATVICLTGFDFNKHSIPPEDIRGGGPPKDGIPAILEPHFIAAMEVTFLEDSDEIIGVVDEGVVKAYPLRILTWHEVVNDRLGETPITVTYCPLTASGIVYDRRVQGKELTFGVSGLLYESNVLFYDHQTESLWSQLKEEAVTGPQTNTRLRPLPSVMTTWKAWREQHPNTLVLSTRTGFQRDYSRSPYEAYAKSPNLMFPVKHEDSRLSPKEKVVGISIGKDHKAYPLQLLRARQEPVEDAIGKTRVKVQYDADADTAQVVDATSGKLLPSVVMYWFAWATFHPDSPVYTPVSSED